MQEKIEDQRKGRRKGRLEGKVGDESKWVTGAEFTIDGGVTAQ